MKRLLSVGIILLFGLSCISQPLLPNGIDAYVGMNLRTLDGRASHTFRKHVESLTGEKLANKDGPTFETWWIKQFTTGNAAWMLLEAYPGYEVPDVSGVQIHAFDANWRRVVKQSFPTGYGLFLCDVDVVEDNPLEQDLLVVKGTSNGPILVKGKVSAIEQVECERQYYALLGEQFAMIRQEDGQNRLLRNSFGLSAPPKGPPIPKRSRAEWTQSLNSHNPAEQLATLVWLSGTHLPSKKARNNDQSQESVEDSKMFEAVRDDPDTRKALSRLADATNPWVQEYAKLALELIND